MNLKNINGIKLLENYLEVCKYFKYVSFNIHTEIAKDILKRYKDLKDKNASLQKEIKLMKSININDNYISKDKIRAKIKELENLYKNKYFHSDYVKEILQELLEEN